MTVVTALKGALKNFPSLFPRKKNHPARLWACQISFSRGTIDLELALGNAVAEPVEAHVDGFGLVLIDGVVEDTIGGAVFGSDRGRGLFVSQFNEGDLVWDCCTGIEVAYIDFRFSSEGEDILHDDGNSAEGGVEEFTIFVAKEEEASCSASGSVGNKVGGITVNVEDHVAGAIEFSRIGLQAMSATLSWVPSDFEVASSLTACSMMPSNTQAM